MTLRGTVASKPWKACPESWSRLWSSRKKLRKEGLCSHMLLIIMCIQCAKIRFYSYKTNFVKAGSGPPGLHWFFTGKLFFLLSVLYWRVYCGCLETNEEIFLTFYSNLYVTHPANLQRKTKGMKMRAFLLQLKEDKENLSHILFWKNS